MNAVPDLLSQTGRGGQPGLMLRVLAGRNEGAHHRLPDNRKLLIGHSFENDIVLRDPSTKGIALHLTMCGRRAVLEVIAGEVAVHGRTMGAGDRATLEPYTPVGLGAVAFALGAEDEDRWIEARELAREDQLAVLEQAEQAPGTDLGERIGLRTGALGRTYLDRLPGPRALAMIGAALLAIAGGTYAGSALLGPQVTSSADIRGELAELGYPGLDVQTGADGRALTIVGLVANDAALTKLRTWVEAEHPDIAIGVDTIATAAEAAQNLLTAQNVDARAIPEGSDSLVIETEFLPQDRQRELETLLRNDLPRVRRFTFNASAERGEADLAYFFNAPGYGAASFVSGDPGYIVTEDGTRWFAGASLPTGHRILEIRNDRVTVERGGLHDTLMM